MNYTFKKFAIGVTTPIPYPEFEEQFMEIVGDIMEQYPSYLNTLTRSLVPIDLDNGNYMLIYDSIISVDNRLTEETDLAHTLVKVKTDVESIIKKFFTSHNIIHSLVNID